MWSVIFGASKKIFWFVISSISMVSWSIYALCINNTKEDMSTNFKGLDKSLIMTRDVFFINIFIAVITFELALHFTEVVLKVIFN